MTFKEIKTVLYVLFPIIFLVSNWIFIYNYGVDIPFWDQWDAEAELYIYYLNNELSLNYFIQPHNEHRIALTRLFNLLIFYFNNGWNPIITMYTQAIIPSFTLYFILKIYSYYIHQKKLLIISSFILFLMFILPIDWENRLWGFQNQFYFMLLLTVMSFYFLLSLSSNWNKFMLVLVVSLLPFTIGSNIIFYFASIPLIIYLIILKRHNLIFLFFILFYMITILFLQFNNWIVVDVHIPLKAKNFQDFIFGFFRGLTHNNSILLIILFILPIAIVLWRKNLIKILKFEKVGYKHLMLICFLIYSYMQFSAFSYGRNGGELSSRYQSIFVVNSSFILLIIFNFFYNKKFFRIPIYIGLLFLFIYYSIFLSNYTLLLNYRNNDQRMVLNFILNKKCIPPSLDKNPFEFIHPNPNKPLNIIYDRALFYSHKWLNSSKIKGNCNYVQ